MSDKLAYSVDEVAALLSLGRNSVKDLIYQGRIKVKRVGRRVIVPRWALDEFLAEPSPPMQGPDWDRMLHGM